MNAHPYAEAWPMLDADELAELADDIATNGLRDPIVTYGDLILDGRNRYAACEQAGVEPTFTEFDGDDDAALAFVQSVNNARRHQSKGSLAASWALSMLAAGKRDGGRWTTYGESPDVGKSEQNARSICGLIADHAAYLLREVVNEDITLNYAHEQAKALRDEHLRKQEEERIAAEAEAKAERFLRDSAPDLAEQVGDGKPYLTFLEAEDIWKRRNAEQARERAEAERREREEKAELERGIRDALGHISNAIQFLAGGSEAAEMYVADTLPHRQSHAERARYLTAEHVDAAIDYLTTIRKAL